MGALHFKVCLLTLDPVHGKTLSFYSSSLVKHAPVSHVRPLMLNFGRMGSIEVLATPRKRGKGCVFEGYCWYHPIVIDRDSLCNKSTKRRPYL